MSFLVKMIHYITLMSAKYGIDDTHGLKHSLDVLQNAANIYKSELSKYPILKHQEQIIYCAAALHDTCDKKYMKEESGLKELEYHLSQQKMKPNDISITKQIIATMSYSKVKKNGYPILGPYQHAYHIVREADLLAAYDFDRCLMFRMRTGENTDFMEAFLNAEELFEKRVFMHNKDNLFVTDYSKKQSVLLYNNAVNRIKVWKNIIKSGAMK